MDQEIFSSLRKSLTYKKKEQRSSQIWTTKSSRNVKTHKRSKPRVTVQRKRTNSIDSTATFVRKNFQEISNLCNIFKSLIPNAKFNILVSFASQKLNYIALTYAISTHITKINDFVAIYVIKISHKKLFLLSTWRLTRTWRISNVTTAMLHLNKTLRCSSIESRSTQKGHLTFASSVKDLLWIIRHINSIYGADTNWRRKFRVLNAKKLLHHNRHSSITYLHITHRIQTQSHAATVTRDLNQRKFCSDMLRRYIIASVYVINSICFAFYWNFWFSFSKLLHWFLLNRRISSLSCCLGQVDLQMVEHNRDFAFQLVSSYPLTPSHDAP